LEIANMASAQAADGSPVKAHRDAAALIEKRAAASAVTGTSKALQAIAKDAGLDFKMLP
jgi:hypothetical protein